MAPRSAARRGAARARRLRLPAALLLVLLLTVPLAVGANDRFTDVPTGNPHHDDISLLADAGITRGCNPPENTAYCPEDVVTRQQMASFLARGLGLGTNPPVANAATARAVGSGGAPSGTVLTADGAGGSSFQSAPVGAQGPTGPQGPAGPQGSPGPQGPSGTTGGDIVLWYAPQQGGGGGATGPANGPSAPVNLFSIAPSGTTSSNASFYFPLDRQASAYGTNLAVKSVQICYAVADANTIIDSTRLEFGERGEGTMIAENTTDQTSTVATCYTVAPPAPVVANGALQIVLTTTIKCTDSIGNALCSGSMTLYSVRLTLGTT